jgi:hypothetical protein
MVKNAFAANVVGAPNALAAPLTASVKLVMI